jgi:hypothetical protein
MTLKNFIPERLAITGLIVTLSLVIVFHILVISGLIPFQIVWGGRLTDRSQMLAFEAFSIIINLLMLSIIAIRAGLIKLNISRKFINIVLWMMSTLFLLNTIGNIFSNNELEKIIFTPLTLLLFLLTFRLALNKNE